MELTVYLAGEIHSNWREDVESAVLQMDLPVSFLAPVTEHSSSDECGVSILGAEESAFWKDHKAAKLNAIRTRTFIAEADVMVVKFGEKYRQWNAAFEAGYAASEGIPLITLHPPELTHALKEIDAAALAVVETPQQVAAVLRYVLLGELPPPVPL